MALKTTKPPTSFRNYRSPVKSRASTLHKKGLNSRSSAHRSVSSEALSTIFDDHKDYYDKRNEGFSGASSVSRNRQDWGTFASKLTGFDVQVITNRAIRAYSSNSWLRAALQTYVVNTLSPQGIKPKSRIYKGDKLDKEKNKEVLRNWNIFNDLCYENNITFYELQQIIVKATLLTGNCFIIKTNSRYDDSTFTFGIDLFSTADLDFTHDSSGKKRDGSYIQFGIEYNSENRPVKYYFKNDNVFTADKVIHIYKPEIPQLKFGISAFTSSLPYLYDIDCLLQNTVLSSRARAGFFLWLKKSLTFDPAKDIKPLIASLSLLESEDKPEVIGADSKVDTELVPLIKQVLTAVAAALVVSYSSISRDLIGESFSGGRLRNQTDEQTFDQSEKFYAKVAFQPVYKWFLEDVINTRTIKTISIKEFKGNKYSYSNCFWLKKKPPYIDPLDEIRMWIEKIKGGLATEKEFFDLFGIDLDEYYEQKAYELNQKKKLGLIEDSKSNTTQTKSRLQKQKEKEREKEE
jgi:lambda family phage portal protein